MYHFNKILAVAFIVLLTGCSIGGEKKIKIFSVEQPREKLNYEMPTPLQMEEIYCHIITSENAEEVFKKLEESGIDPVLFGLTDEDYELMQRNNVQMRNQIIRYRQIIEAYKEYYESKDEKSESSKDDFKPKSFKKNG